MDSKPVITYAGDTTLFKELERGLLQALPKESTEWRRTFGKIHNSVYVDPVFVPFSLGVLPKPDDFKLIDQPVLHMYWTECSDLDTYKTSVREDIEQWLKSLNGADWMVVIVEVYDIRKSNKLLPRTTVVDKVRTDFAGKQGDRVITLINPIKSESKSAESWRGLINRIRVLLLSAYNVVLSKYQNAVRLQRESQKQSTWSFCNFFLIQEELALIFEMLGLYEEALLQYDELDALFAQFVHYSALGEHPKWLSSFSVPLHQWAGPNLSQKITKEQKESLKYSKLDLLQFRSYLFGRQSSLLLLLCKPWEMAQRASTFIHNSLKELKILEVTYPEGAIACWVFLVCLEVLHTCDKFNDSAQVEAYSLYTAELHTCARSKLKQLGELCGLTPGPGPTSEQLHTVVGLSSGMGDPPPNTAGPTPVDKLKEALASKEAYNTKFLELSELAIISYKHIGRLRSARLVGQDLAKFYMSLGQPEKATPFLLSSLTGFQSDNWLALAADTQLLLAECYLSLDDVQKYVTTCCVIAASSDLDNITRITYFHKLIECSKVLPTDGKYMSRLEDMADVTSTETAEFYQLSQGQCLVSVSVVVNNKLPGPVKCSNISLSLEPESTQQDSSSHKTAKRTQNKTVFRKLSIQEWLNYNKDQSLHSANVICNEPPSSLSRSNSRRDGRKISAPSRNDFDVSLSAQDVTLQPGVNSIVLNWTASEVGSYRLGQMSMLIERMELLGSVPGDVSFRIDRQASTVELNVGPGELLAGLPQEMTLTVNAGSYHIKQGDVLRVMCSIGLSATDSITDTDDNMKTVIDVKMPSAMPFQTVILPLRFLAVLSPQRDQETSSILHTVCLKCTWCEEEVTLKLSFQPPFKSLLRLHTALEKKFIQINVIGLTTQMLELDLPKLTVNNKNGVRVKCLNPAGGQAKMVAKGLTVSLLWELEILNDTNNEDNNIKLELSVGYSPIYDLDTLETTSNFRTYKCQFELHNYKTLYVIRCNVEPGKDLDFCRVGAMCQLLLEVAKSSVDSFDVSLMYEVLADQAMWAVLGRAAGVITLDRETKQNITLDVMPLAQGFLPLPLVRLSKYIPALERESAGPRLEAFNPGQVYSASKSRQVHILPAITNE